MPWLVWKLILLMIAIVGETVFFVICVLAFVALWAILTRMGRSSWAAMLVLVGAVIAAYTFMYGLGLVMWIIMSIIFCPFQLIAGM